ncbi:MAG: hypothetical protein MK160_06220 [Rhodobacteraceae bacterium]|nr:hypothetical protein [Paracoccaceae bacterium]
MKKLIISAIIATAGLTASAASATTYWVQEGIKLNARTGPSTYYHAVGKFHGCTKLHVVAYKKGWAKVAYKHDYYWVSAKYLQNHACYKAKKHYKHY